MIGLAINTAIMKEEFSYQVTIQKLSSDIDKMRKNMPNYACKKTRLAIILMFHLTIN